MKWKEDFEYWLTNNMYVNRSLAELIVKHVDHYYKPVDDSNPSAPKQVEDDLAIWENAAIDLFKLHNPGKKIIDGIMNGIYLGFSKDMDYLRERGYQLTRK